MAYLEFIEGLNQGTRFPITGQTMIGRSPNSALCLPDSRASRQHAVIDIKGNQFLLTDLGSANGTFVNGIRLEKNVPHILRENDTITICSTTMVFHTSATTPAEKDERTATVRGLGTPASAKRMGGLSLVMTGEERGAPAVNATLDASISMADFRHDQLRSEKQMQEAIKRLQAMVQVSNDLGGVTDQEEMLDKIMVRIFDIFPHADRALILLRDPETDTMQPAVWRTRQKKGEEEEVRISRTILRIVTEKKQSVLSSDALSDDRFSAQQSIVDLSIRSMMCAPLLWKDEMLGAINVDTQSALRSFNEDDLAMLTAIASQAAVALKSSQLYEAVQIETANRVQLSRYLSPDVVEGVLDGRISLELGGKTANGTVFFCDIVGFTKMSEGMTAVQVIDKLNRYYRLTTDIITRNRGTLHKFGGDMIMAFWNVLFPDDSQEMNAILTSLQMQTAVWAFDLELEREGQSPIYLGIGCNTGSFAAGNIGGEGRMEYTIIGDNVNLGQRIESLSGRWQVLVAQSTYNGAADRCLAVSLPPVMVKGKSAPIQVYSIRGIMTSQEEFCLDIPVHLLGPDGKPRGRGILIGAHGSIPAIRLDLETDSEVKKDQALAIEFDVPELPAGYRLVGKAIEVQPVLHDGQPLYSKVVLGSVQAEPHVLAFFRPGACIPSPKSWDEMKRH